MIINCLVPKESLAGKTHLVFKASLQVESWNVSEVNLITWPTWLLYKVNIINKHLISCILKENCFGRKDCSWVAFDSLFSNAYVPESAGKSCLLGGLPSICFFGILRVIQTHLYLGFHHVFFCCKYQSYWQISAPLILLSWLEMQNSPALFFDKSIFQRYNERQQGLKK